MIEKQSKEYSKFSKFYNIKDQIISSILRSSTFLPFGLELMKYPIIFTEHVPGKAAASTDFKNIYVNPNDQLFTECNVDINTFLTFVLLHEIGHNILMHKVRGEGKDKELWNYATDYFWNLFLRNIEIENRNWDSQHALISMQIDKYSDKILFNESFAGMIEEEIYAKLQSEGNFKKTESEKSYKDFLDDVGIPSEGIDPDSKIKITKTELSFDGHTDKKTFVEFPENEMIGSEGKESSNSNLAKTMFESRVLGKGFENENFEKFIKRMFSVKVPWETLLRDSILIELQKKGDITYSRPRLSWLCNSSLPYMPNIQEEENFGTLVLLIDESGSMTEEDISKAVGIAQESRSYYKNIFIIKHDTKCLWSKLYEDTLTSSDIDELCVRKHKGGTSHREAFEKVLEFEQSHDSFVSLVLCLTDMISDIPQSQKILPSRIPRIYLKVLDYKVEGINGKVIDLK